MRLYGKNPVIERLKSNPKSIMKIYVQEGQPDSAYIRRKAKQWGIPFLLIPRAQMIKMGQSLNTQGVLVEVEDFIYTPYDDILETAKKKNGSMLFLDELKDPQNLGAIIRSLACLGGFSVVLPLRESVEVTEAVLRVASGGENLMMVAKVTNLAQAIDQAKQQGFWIAGAVTEQGQDLTEISLPFPLSLVLGSEQKGIREGIRKRLDLQLTIPMPQAKLSFNVAQAATIFCYEIIKQKQQKKNSAHS